MIEDRHLEEYKTYGYTVVENFLTPEELKIAQWETLKLKRWLNIYNMKGKPRDAGTGRYWEGVECAGLLSPELMKLYTSKKQYETAKLFLETDDVYLFNDEVVVKMPQEEFEFMLHTDNDWGPDPQAAKRGDYKSVNINWMLDDMTKKNGPVKFMNKRTKRFESPLPKAGDVIIFDGNVLHASQRNMSDKVRRCWATIYTNKNIGYFFENKKYPLPLFKGFYTERFDAR